MSYRLRKLCDNVAHCSGLPRFHLGETEQAQDEFAQDSQDEGDVPLKTSQSYVLSLAAPVIQHKWVSSHNFAMKHQVQLTEAHAEWTAQFNLTSDMFSKQFAWLMFSLTTSPKEYQK